MKAAFLLVCCILLGLAGALLATQKANTFCPANYHRAAKGDVITNTAAPASNQAKDATKKAVTPGNEGHATPQAQQAKESAGGEYPDWWTEFVCKATATDYAIAFFTYCLVIVGIFGMWSAERLTRDSERAHLFPFINAALDPNGNSQISIVPENSGRSAGILREVYGEFRLKKPWGLRYQGGVLHTFDQVVGAGEKSLQYAGFVSAFKEPHYFIGYMVYLDMFRVRHKCYFCMAVTPGVGVSWNEAGWHSRWLNRFY